MVGLRTSKADPQPQVYSNKNANARTSHCMHTYAGLTDLIISQRFINSASVKSAIDRYTNYYTHE